MSCDAATAPIDISLRGSAGKCDLKCDLTFQYKGSDTCVATNRGDYVGLTYADNAGFIKYNTQNYAVREIRLYHPSLHSFNGVRAAAELVVVHSNTDGGNDLLICLPIETVNSSGGTASLFDSITAAMASHAPANGERTSVTVEEYNLEDIVPKKPFFSYEASLCFQPCNRQVTYAVFTDRISMSSASMETLASIVSPNPYTIKEGISFFYNEKGPGASGADGIYIDCRPVGQSEEEEVVHEDAQPSVNFSMKSPTVQVFVGIVGFLVLLAILGWAMNYAS